MAKILLKLLLLLFAVVVAHAIHDPKYEGIKTKTYHRDPLIAQAFDQQQQQPQYQTQQHPNFHHSHNNYQTSNVDATERLSPPPIHSSNNQYQPARRPQQQQQQPPSQGSSYYDQQQQQELPLYQRSNYDERHTPTTPQAPRPIRRDDAENAITEYYTGCPSQYTGQLPYAYDCRRFLNCWNGRGHIQTCAPGTVFNSETLECDRPDKVVCGTLGALGRQGPNPQPPLAGDNRAGRLMNDNTESVETLCPPGATGLQPHPTDCTKFVNCASGSVHVQACGPGTAYSIPMMTCDFRHKVDCRGRGGGGMAETPNPTYASSRKNVADISSSTSTSSLSSSSSKECVCPPSVVGLYPHPSDCTKFLNCVHGSTFVQDCGPGTAFDSVKLVCDFKQKVNCSSSVGSGIAYASSDVNRKPKHEAGFSNSNQTTTGDILCPVGVRGLFVYPFDYTKFMNCKNDNTAIENCVRGTVFSISKGFCDAKDNIISTDRVAYIVSEISYEYSKSVTYCPPGTDGIHLYPFDGVKYLKCISEQMFILECAAGTAFSISRKLCLPKQQVRITDRVKYVTEIMQELSTMYSYGASNARNDQRGVVCSNSMTGLYPFPFDSTKYVSCLNGKLTIETCTSGSVFSLSKKHCHLRENIDINDRVRFHGETIEEWSLEESYDYTNYGQAATVLKCPQKKNGFFLHPFDCTKYLNCQNGVTIIENCASGSVFSISTRLCVSRNQVEAYDRVEYLSESQHEFSSEFESNTIKSGALICPPGYDGLYPHQDNSKTYLKCTKGRTIVENCAVGMVFSISKRYCDYEKNIQANDQSTYKQSNTIRSKFNFDTTTMKTELSNENTSIHCTKHISGIYPHPGDCTKFINCDNSVAHVKSCAPGTAWSIELEVCDFKEKVNCNGRMGHTKDYENSGVHKLVQGSVIQGVSCPSRANGLYPHPFNYNKYFSCYDGNSNVQNCHRGSIYSISRRRCAAEEDVSDNDHVAFVSEFITHSPDILSLSLKSITCPPTATGYHIYPFDCEKFIKCENDHTFVENCPPGTVFSISNKRCILQKHVLRWDRVWFFTETLKNNGSFNELNDNTKIEFTNENTSIHCTKHASGMYPHPDDCTKFINCDNSVAHVKSCAPGTAWSIELEVCDFKENVNCNGRMDLTKEFGTPNENSGVRKLVEGSTLQRISCPNKANGFYPHPFDYNKFINCHAGKNIVQNCKVGSIFSISRRRCSAQGEVNATDHVVFVGEFITNSSDVLYQSMEYIICPSTGKGYHIYPFDCHKYIKCENDRTLVEDCPPGTVFSISKMYCILQNQVLRNDRVWFFTETLQENGFDYSDSDIVCPSGVTGLYQHPYDCQKFLNCVNGQTLIEECGPGRIFSLSRKFCDLDGNVAASDRINNSNIYAEYDYNNAKTPAVSSVTPTCPFNANGVHPHPYDCTKYLNCTNGLTYIQDCTSGTAWNVFTKLCDFKGKVNCSNRKDFRVSEVKFEQDSKGAGNSKMSCPAGVYGVQPHPFDCKKFINCANDVAHIQECAPGTAWDIAMETCDFFANVDCSTRQSTALHALKTDQIYSNNNRDSNSHTNEGSEYYSEDDRYNSGQNQPKEHPQYHHQNWQNTNSPGQHPQTRNPGQGDRWTNMNMPRPDANLNIQTQYDETNQNTETEPTWSGVGSSIHRQSPASSVLYVEGSLQPDNYGNTIKTYSAPLAPFSQNTAADSLTTTTSRTNTNIYYAQPVGSQEDSQETYHPTRPGMRPNLSRNPSVNAPNWQNHRQNNSREINYHSTVNTWTPFLDSTAPQSHSVPNPNQNFLPPYPSTPQRPFRPQDTYPNRQPVDIPATHLVPPPQSPHPVNTPVTHLMPPPQSDRGQRPQDEPEFKLTTIDLDKLPDNGQFDISAYDQYPSGSNPTPNMPTDSSNLYGGLRPPPPSASATPTETRYPNFIPAYPATQNKPQPVHEERQPTPYTPQQANTTPRTYLYAPTNPTDSTNRRDDERYPSIINATMQTFSDPHYSPPYSGVSHSRNATWSNIGRKIPLQSSGSPGYSGGSGYSGDVNSNPYHPVYDDDFITTSTERRNILPQTYNRQYYPPTVPKEFNEETSLDEDNLHDLPISDALRMLLRPYFNRSGTVSENAADQAESHIMNLVAQAKNVPTSTSTTTITPPPISTTTSTTTFKPTTIQDVEDDDDVELIIAGEQHSLINIPTQSSTQETKNYFHVNQKNLTSQKSNRQTHEHSRDFHLRHPHLPNPFPEAEHKSLNPNRNVNLHKHHHPHMNMHHSREFHLRHPKMPNPFGGTREGDISVVDKEILETPNPYAESTTPTNIYNPDIDIRIDENNKGSQFDCGNGKRVKAFEVCDGVNNCGNRKDESRCEHLGYEVRLTGGESTNVGRVEVKSKWGYVCDDKFGLRDADVVCKELGFQLGANEVRGNSFYPPADVNFPFVMDEVDCRGNESSLRECDFKGWGVNNCGPDEVVGVVCKVPLYKCPNNHWLCSTSKECIPTNFVCDNTPDCQDKSDESDKICNSPVEYRLEGGRSVNEGRVEVKYRGEWGTVCDDDFGLKEAQVVCNSLGYYGEPKIEKNIFGLGSGPIWLDQVSCFGNETSIDKCNHWTWGEHNCNHTEDVGIKCTAGPPPRRSSKNGRTILSPSSAEDNQQSIPEGQTSLEDIGLYPGQWERSSKFVNNQRRCGHFKQDLNDEYEHPEERVVNGTIARRGHHPWQATIRTRGRGGVSGHWCGAVLISKKHLLTAAHCLAGYPKGAYFIRLGDHYANIAESSEIDSYIENWYLHEKFRDNTHMNNDIALIVLKNPVRFNDYIQPICLPEKGAQLKENRMCTISGWGSIKSGVSTPSNILRAAQLPILKDDTCKQTHVYGTSVTDGMFCAGTMDESVDACDGDSGGPLVCSDDDGETLYGIISWGQQCGYANKPGVYVRVEKYIDWIFEKINFSIQQTARH